MNPVRYELIYRAKLPCGDIIESENLKSIYYAVRRDLRTELGELSEGVAKPYMLLSTQIEFGVLESEELKPGYFRSEWHQLKMCGTLFVSDISSAYIRAIDNKQLVNFRPFAEV